MDLTGKDVIVTGGNVGIGRPTALELARRGASVTILGRNEVTCQEAVSQICAETGNDKVDYKVVDLASFSEIQKFAEDFISSHTKLDILVNNAGVVRPPINTTEQGIEATVGINYLGHFFLTHLLKELLISVQGRVVVVASKAYEYFEITLDSLEGENPGLFKPVEKPEIEQYCKSNIARVMYARELVKRYPEISCASLHPGTIDTEVYRSSGALYLCIASCMRRFWKTPEQGAQTSIYCATADLGDGNGGYFVNSALRAFNEKQINDEVQQKLWEVSMGLVKKFLESQGKIM